MNNYESNVREGHGFTLYVRRAEDLESVQTACRVQTYNRCLIARYHLRADVAFGNLFAAFLRDLHALSAKPAQRDFLGRLDPKDPPQWKAVLSDPAVLSIVEEARRKERGAITLDVVTRLLAALAPEKVLAVGDRLVLLGEVIGSDGPSGSVEAWSHFHEEIASKLPERVILVLSGCPQGFDPPVGDPRWLLVESVGGSAPRTTDAGEGTPRLLYQHGPLQPDRPDPEDRLGRKPMALALAAFLMQPQTQPPITIGIHGRWGQGKSSFLEMIDVALMRAGASLPRPRPLLSRARPWLASRSRWLDRIIFGRLEQPQIAGAESVELPATGPRETSRTWRRIAKAAEHYVVTTRFNAWQYNDATQTWAGLASVVSERMESVLPWWRRAWLRWTYAWTRHREEIVLNFLLPFALVVLVGVFAFYNRELVTAWYGHLVGGGKDDPQAPGPDEGDAVGKLLAVLVPAGSALAIIWLAAWRFLRVVQPISERVAGYVRRTDHRAQMGYQHRVMEDLQFVHRHLRRHRPACKVAIYIDDMDRCSDDKVMEILQAINLVLASCEFFVFLGMDTQMIHGAINAWYRKTNKDTGIDPALPDQYLRKIVQLSIHLPESSADRRFELVSRLFSADARAKAVPERSEAPSGERLHGPATLPYDLDLMRPPRPPQVVVDTADEILALAELKDFLDSNPRELKRLLNRHRLVKILLSEDGAEWPAERQRKLVKWMLFCARWPDLVDDALKIASDKPRCSNCVQELVSDCEENNDSPLAKFGRCGEPLASTDLLGDFDRAALLTQVVTFATAPARASSTPAAAPP